MHWWNYHPNVIWDETSPPNHCIALHFFFLKEIEKNEKSNLPIEKNCKQFGLFDLVGFTSIFIWKQNSFHFFQWNCSNSLDEKYRRCFLLFHSSNLESMEILKWEHSMWSLKTNELLNLEKWKTSIMELIQWTMIKKKEW